jgi:hypothetical protein
VKTIEFIKALLTKVRPEILALLVLLSFQTYLISSSNGFYYIDEGAHFMDDFAALRHPSVSIGVWQRFGSVWIFTLPAQFGPVAVKIFASLLFLLTIFVAYKVAELEQLPYKEWIIVLAGFQPMLLDISFTCLAELPATLFLILAYYLYKKSLWKLSLSVASMVFLFRYEMSFLAILIFIIAVRQRKYSALPFAVLGPALWYAFSLIWTGDPAWLAREFVKFGSLPKFIEGTGWFHYLKHSFAIFGTVQVCLVEASLLFALLRRKQRLAIPLLTVLWCIVFNTLASAKDFNWTPSVGDFRYLAPVAPFVALLSLDGLAQLMESLRKVSLSKYIPAVLGLLMVYGALSVVRPHSITPFENGVMVLTRRAATDSTGIPILSNHWASRFSVMNNETEIDRIEGLTETNYLRNSREYIVWDSQIANSIFSQEALTFEEVKTDPDVKLVESINLGYGVIYLFLRDVAPHKAENGKEPARLHALGRKDLTSLYR